MYSREWIYLPLILCNLIVFSFNTFTQPYLPFFHTCDSLHQQIDTVNHQLLEEVSISAYNVLKAFPRKDVHLFDSLHRLLHTCEALEIQPDIRGRLLAQRIRIGIDQAILIYHYKHLGSLQTNTDSIDRFLFENASAEAVGLAYKSTYRLEEVSGISHGWAIDQLHFPSPQTDLQMTKLLLVGRLIQEVHSKKLRNQFTAPKEKWKASTLKELMLLNINNLSREYIETLVGNSISLERLYEVNLFHLVYPFIGKKSFFKEELPNLFMAAAHHEPYHQETIEILQSLGGSWLKVLNPKEINPSEVKAILLSTPLLGVSQVKELEFLISLGSNVFPHFRELLQETNNRLLLARIIHVLTNMSEDKSEMIPDIRAKLFELYFLYKGEFLSAGKLSKEFSTMGLLEGRDLMLLLIYDRDQQIRLSALKRLSEIGDSYTYRKLKNILLETNYGLEKKTVKQAETSLNIMYDRLIPPDPLEISLSSPILEGQSLNTYSVVADQMPQFPGGRDALSNFLVKRTKAIHKYPLDGIVMLRFVVDTEGNLSNIQIVNSLHPLYDQRAIEIIKSMPKWQPGVKNGKAVAVSQHLTIAFKR